VKLVLQGQHSKACHHACIAMLAGRDLQNVIRDAGHDVQLDLTIREKLYDLYRLNVPRTRFIIQPFSDGQGLAELMRNHRTLLCSAMSWKDPGYAHSIVIHDGELYDPSDGMNPNWPWHRVIAMATPVENIQ
jgi:hypothetical protein